MEVQFPRLVVVSHEAVSPDRHLCRPLVGVAGSKNPYVAIAVGHADGGFVLGERSGNRAEEEARIAEARRALTKQPWSWAVAEQSGFWLWKRPSLLRGMGDAMVPIAQMATDGGGVDDLATELLLIPAAMADAAATLKSEVLFAAVPKRGWLLVAAGQIGNPFAAQAMHAAAEGIASRGGRSAVSGTIVLLWQGGRLVGVDGREGGSGYISMQGEDEAEWWPRA